MTGLTLKTQRNSNIEILRIIGMLFIIMQHALSLGVNFDSLPEITHNVIFFQTFTGCIGWLGNMLFIIISGYFLYDSKFSLKKILKLWAELFFYSAGISLIIYLFNIQIYGVAGSGFCFTRLVEKRSLKISELLYSFLPFCTAQNWFATKYIVFLFFVPFLNVMVSALSPSWHKMLIILCFVIFHVFPLITYFDVYVPNDYTAFLLLFFVGSYMRKYENFLQKVSSAAFIAAGSALIVIYIVLKYVFLYIYGGMQNIPPLLMSVLYSSFVYNFLLTWAAVLLFAGAMRLPFWSNRIVNLVASSTFGIYLIHNHNYLRRNIWLDFFHINEKIYESGFVLWILADILIVFAVCCAIDFLRKFFVEPVYFRAIEKICR
ncbi:MAG: acyltransferase [Treponema sp.]|nr:acyltransferase [Treponema sp.]